MATLQSRLADLITELGTDWKAVQTALAGKQAFDELRLVFDREDGDELQQIWRSRPDGTGAVKLTDDPDYHSWWPKVSPDGNLILFLRTPSTWPNPDDVSHIGDWTLWVMNYDGTGVIELVSDSAYSGGLGTPGWHPNGDKIVFSANDGAFFEIKTIRTDGSGGAEVVATGISGVVGLTDTSYSPDGSLIYFCASSNVYVVSAAGGTAIALTTDGATTPNYDPVPSLDGTKVAMLTRLVAETSCNFA